MRARPKSNWVNEDGAINLAKVGVEPEFPEAIAWEKEYADKCDQLAEIEAIKTGKKHWGRWYLTRKSLNTIIIRPKVGERGAYRGSTYEISLDRLNENWVEHMSRKNWLGEKGLKDLAIALEVLGNNEVLKPPRHSARLLAKSGG